MLQTQATLILALARHQPVPSEKQKLGSVRPRKTGVREIEGVEIDVKEIRMQEREVFAH